MAQYNESRLADLYSLLLRNEIWKTYGCVDFGWEKVDFLEGNQVSNQSNTLF